MRTMPAELSHSQDKILYQIKRLGPQTIKSLADRLGVTTMGVRQHIAQLENEDLLVARAPVMQKRGRPVKTWKLTAKGHRRFPDAHAQVTTELIASVRDLLGEQALDQLINHRTQTSLAGYRQALAPCATLAARIEKLAEVRSAEGYMAEVKKLSAAEFLLIEHHCPICIAATSCQGFCSSELEVFQALLTGSTIVREEHLLNGARRCSYRISQIAST